MKKTFRICYGGHRLALLVALLLGLGWVSGAIAQGGGIFVTITGVESRTFPQVGLWVAAADENGPLEGLTAADFRVVEDGAEVPATDITVENDTLSGLRLVLALDVSMPANDLAQVQAAAKELIQTMDPRDRVAVLTLADQVTRTHEFTNNSEELQAVIDSLGAGGNFTALHEGIFDAATLMEEFTTGRKAIVVVTDSRDNTGTMTVDQVIDHVQQSGAPLYIIGFGSKVTADPLRSKVALTGGQYFALPGANQLQATFQEVEQRLRSGYRLTFTSGLTADDAEHEVSLTVSHQGGQGQAQSRFVAGHGQVTISLSNISEGQTVGGVINLAPEITAPASLVSATYRLDGQLLTEVTAPPYNFEWDTTTVEAGPHQLTIEAVDQAGNKGETTLALTVAMPIKVTISTPRTEIQLGDEVVIQAKIEAITDLVKVELLLDGKPVASNNAPPYGFSFDTSDYLAGTHEITVQAEDSLGRTATDQLTMQFVTPPAPQPPFWQRWINQFRQSRWSRYLVIGAQWVAVALVLIALVVIGLLVIAKVQQRGAQKTLQLELANLGNSPSRYELLAEDPVGALKFQFTLNGVRLPQQSVAETMDMPPASVMEMAGPAPMTSASPASSSRGGVRQSFDHARSTGVEARGCVAAIAGIFTTLGYLLPGSAGRSVQQVGQRLYAGQARVDRAVRAPARISRTAGQLQRQVKQVTPGAGSSAGPRAGVWQTASGPVTVQAPGRQSLTSNGRQVNISVWAQTPFVEPGQTLLVDLLIAPLKKPYRTQPYAFKVFSKTIEPEDAPLVTEEGQVEIAGVSRFRRLLPYLILAVIMIVIALVLIALLTNLDAWIMGFFSNYQA